MDPKFKGLVVDDKATVVAVNCYLRYFFDTIRFDRDALDPSRLLLAPTFVFKYLFASGYLRVERSTEPGSVKTLDDHVFWDLWNKAYVNAAGSIVARPPQETPVGLYAISESGAVSDLLERAVRRARAGREPYTSYPTHTP